MDTQESSAPAADKKTINVSAPFTVIVGGNSVRVEAGVQKVDAEIAEHWYTQLHLVQGGFGTAEYAKACRDAADAAFVIADAAIKKYAGLEDAAQEAERAAGLDPVKPAIHRLRARPEPGDDGDEDRTTGSDDPEPASPGADTTVEGSSKSDSIDGGEPADDDDQSPDAPAEEAPASEAPAEDPYPNLSPAQEQALDRDGDGKPGGAPKGGNRRHRTE
jgi:hypothetical protein